MFSRLFGSKKKEEEKHSAETHPNPDWSFLEVDFHSHFIPGIDDGAQTIEDSLTLIKGMQEMGYKRLITTPHINLDHYPNTPEIINAGLAEVRKALAENNIQIPIKAAAEYFIDDNFIALMEKEPLMPVDGNQVLVELSFMFEPSMLNDILFRMQTLGYKPILAHPERYSYLHTRQEMYSELKDRGCYLQLNANALTGYYGKGVKMVAENLLEKGLYDYIGSDMHNERHLEVLRSLLHTKVYDTLYHYPFLNKRLFTKN